jgi:hypothetical protein
MGKAQCLGVQDLSWTEGKAVLDILFVFLCAQTFEHLHAAILLISEEWMSDGLHMYAYLVCATCLQATFHEGDIRETFQDAPVGNGLFGVRVLL